MRKAPLLIVALDFDQQHDALSLADQLDPQCCSLKVGSELFTRWGGALVQQLIHRQFKVFLDLKFHDIPNTVARACKSAADLGVWMMNVHAAGGLAMMRAAVESLESYGPDKPLLTAVTVLTSLTQEDLEEVGFRYEVQKQVAQLALLAKKAGVDGVVCSAQEVRTIKAICGDRFITVTPGIRLPDDNRDDQSRVMTPRQALQEGSDYLVMGRPITKSPDPASRIRDILAHVATSEL